VREVLVACIPIIKGESFFLGEAMSAYVVKCTDLAQLKQQWDSIILNHSQHVPKPKFQSDTAFRNLVQDLAKHPRIQWFLYTENDTDIALRLYDSPFKHAYPRYFQTNVTSSGREWVILRGKNFGSNDGPFKQAMRRAFGVNIWPTGNAPNPGGVRLKNETKNRLDYFEDKHHNNAGEVIVDEEKEIAIQVEKGPTMIDLLRQFGQVILYGPPGTGKTREAKRVALSLLSGSEPSAVATAGQIEEQLTPFHQSNRYEIVVFHPAYEYEQFVGGIEPMIAGEQLAFRVRPGVFLRLCRHAEQSSQPAVLLIDEINRGNLPKLLGELVYALEYRAPHRVSLPIVCDGRNDLVVPTRLYIIATMNSSDRSIGHIDVAIRRRFGLVHIGPNPDVVRNAWKQIKGVEAYGEQLAGLMTALNQALGGEDPTAEVELGVGHSYFLPNPGSSRDESLKQVRMKWKYQVQPLLREYAQLLNLGLEFFARFRELPPLPAGH
jgi:hypothetical protein